MVKDRSANLKRVKFWMLLMLLGKRFQVLLKRLTMEKNPKLECAVFTQNPMIA